MSIVRLVGTANMPNLYTSLHTNTPTVAGMDGKRRVVRTVCYLRIPDVPTSVETRITRYKFDSRDHAFESIDPRLHAEQQTDATLKPNFTFWTSLSGKVLRTDSVDSGSIVTLYDSAARRKLEVNALGVRRTWQYENTTLPGRILNIRVQEDAHEARIEERFVWATNTTPEHHQNLAGQCTYHYDRSGFNCINSIAINGAQLSLSRYLIPEAEDALGQGPHGKDLQPETFTTMHTADAEGSVLSTMDAMGNVQRLSYDLVGQVKCSWLTMIGEEEKLILKSVAYSPTGQPLREEHANGVVSTFTYDPQFQLLSGIKVERPIGHSLGARVLQNLRYEYDPVGNVVTVTNDAQATRYWRNQKIIPESTYIYDSLYQLISATGRETVGIHQRKAMAPCGLIHPSTGRNTLTAYTRYYSYDTGGNLTQIRHRSPVANNNYTTSMTVSKGSNRAILSTLCDDPKQVELYFTTGGHQKELHPGQQLLWTTHGELLQVSPVTRDGDTNDYERYIYAGRGHRVMKITLQKNKGVQLLKHAIYLPGLELRSTAQGLNNKQQLQIITLDQHGATRVRIFRSQENKSTYAYCKTTRYSYANLGGSSELELDCDGNIISFEEYYPYGGTAVWNVTKPSEADYKTLRYSGKERDATGLYYFGARYYQPWTGRWLSSDPAQTVDGLNLYCMVKNNPITFFDPDGRVTRGSNWLAVYQENVRKISAGELTDNPSASLDSQNLSVHINTEPAEVIPPAPGPSRSTAPLIPSDIERSGRYLMNIGSPPISIDTLREQIQNANIDALTLIRNNAAETMKSLIKTRSKQEYIFALSEKKGLRLLTKGFNPLNFKEPALHHQNIFIGRNDILSAGTMYIQDGRATFTNFSGHFKPSDDTLRHVESFLLDAGLKKKHIAFSHYLKVNTLKKRNNGFFSKLYTH